MLSNRSYRLILSGLESFATGIGPEPVIGGENALRNQSMTHSCRILIIDDSRDASYTLKMLLSKAGYAVETAGDGQRGVDAAKLVPPDIVFCDINMPGMDGYQVAQALRSEEITRGAYLVALTGYDRDDDRLKALQAGFDEHLVKPVGWSTLKALIAAVPRHDST
jgi:CheY-like chemotaxis protein